MIETLQAELKEDLMLKPVLVCIALMVLTGCGVKTPLIPPQPKQDSTQNVQGVEHQSQSSEQPNE